MICSIQPAWSESSAVVEAAKSASEQMRVYKTLGSDVSEWAEKQATTDATASIRAVQTFLKVHRLAADFDSESEIMAYYRNLWICGKFIPLWKWAIAVPLAGMAGVKVEGGATKFADLPARPDFVEKDVHPLRMLFPVGSTALVRCLRTRLAEKTRAGRPTKRALNLAWSLLGIKAMFPGMWVDRVGESLRDHSGLLGTPPPPLSSELEAALVLVADSINRLMRDKHQASDSSYVEYKGLPRPRLSASAGWVKMYDTDSQRWVSMKGTRAAVYSTLSGLQGKQAEELFSMGYHPHSGVREYRQHAYSFKWNDWDFDPLVSVVALQEPFKIRTISIADGPATAAASPFQATWHRIMKRLFPFSLIGGARVADRVMGQLDSYGNKRFSFDSGQPFVSGDYSAATDRLSVNATRLVFDRLMVGVSLPQGLRERLEASLMGSVLDYSRTLESFRGKIPDALLDSVALPPKTAQQNGQLMGNILSFPILCLVNLSGWVAMARESKELSPFVAAAFKRGYFEADELDDLPVLINGDDILFQCDPSDYQRWLDLVLGLGLKPSVGKNYYSDEFFTINSELYTRDGFQTRPWWGGFETDLVKLRNEVKFETGEDVLSADMRRVLPKLQSFLRETIPAASWPITNRLWLQLHHSYGVLGPYSGLNWFIPVEFGGMGLDPTGWGAYETTFAQKKLAVRMSLDPDFASRFFPGAEGSLVTADSLRLLRSSVPTTIMAGEIVKIDGRKFVLDKHAPVVVRMLRSGLKTMARLHELVDSWSSGSKHIDHWLDYHMQGTRVDKEKVVKGVHGALLWGLRLSNKRVASYEALDVRPRFRCLRSTELIPWRNILVANEDVRF